MPNSDNTLVNAMLEPEFYNHPVQQVQLIETHISWVFLTGDYAYKIKKPVDFGFLDFTRLERRKFYCEEELRLNSRLAADIYLNVTPITKADGTFQLDGDGEPVEYAVKMKQFDPHSLLKQLLEDDQIHLQHIEQLADKLADFHQQIECAGAHTPFGQSGEVIKPVAQNFSLLRDIVSDAQDLNKLLIVEQAAMKLHQQLKTVFDDRKQQGFIRECHGDMHLGNIALIDDRILIFDGIEFNDSFKWIDTMSELAFLVMDLQDQQRDDFASRVVNRYLSRTGDYQGLQVLRFYQMYRAMVRAKVNGLQMQQQTDDAARHEYQHDMRNYLDLAIRYTETPMPFIAITYGLSGSGKSWLAAQLAEYNGAIIIRSDVERKRLFSEQQNLYSKDTTRQTYDHLIRLASDIYAAGYPVLIDATFLERENRDRFKNLAQQLDARFSIIHCHADIETLQQRIRQRQVARKDESDADIEVLKMQLARQPGLAEDESNYTLDVDTGGKPDIAELAERLAGAGN
mgnify:FL=1